MNLLALYVKQTTEINLFEERKFEKRLHKTIKIAFVLLVLKELLLFILMRVRL